MNAAEAEKGPAEDQSVFRRRSYYRVLFFLLKIVTVELQNSYRSILELNARVVISGSKGPRTKVSFLAQKQMMQRYYRMWVLEGTIITFREPNKAGKREGSQPLFTSGVQARLLHIKR